MSTKVKSPSSSEHHHRQSHPDPDIIVITDHPYCCMKDIIVLK